MVSGRSTQIPNAFPINFASPLSARVKFPVYSFEPLFVHVGVNLCRRNIGVAQHFLDDPQIRTVSEQVRREAMPQKVRIYIFFHATAPRVLLNDLPNSRCR